jgi:hypothetical protein
MSTGVELALRSQVDHSLNGDIQSRVQDMVMLASEQGTSLNAPVLAMGISERVGSNWFLDAIGTSMSTCNEPYRQQLHDTHVLSALNPDMLSLSDLSVNDTHPYERHWLTTFVASKYGERRHLLKETNLFFAVDNYLDLFPDSPVIVLGRNPVGIASSFEKGKLFDRWQYGDRYSQMQSMVQRPEMADFAFTVESDGTDNLDKLGRLILLNTLLISNSLGGRVYSHVPYESATSDQALIYQRVSQELFGDSTTLMPNTSRFNGSRASADGTFNTNVAMAAREAHLTGEDITRLCRTMNSLLLRAADVLPMATVVRATGFLDIDEERYAPLGRNTGKMNMNGSKKDSESAPTTVESEFVDIEGQEILWRNTHVTNQEYCDFLNSMYEAGVPNIINGTQLFMNENMLNSRGGRMHFDEADGKYHVSEGYEGHPVYWVTWIGANAFAKYSGARLPSKEEADSLIVSAVIDIDKVNADYVVGDVVPVVEEDRGQQEIHHVIGNVAMWCGDSPEQTIEGPLMKYMYGTAWNKPSSSEQARKYRARPLTGNSRSTGIRLVTDRNAAVDPMNAAEIARRLKAGFKYLSPEGAIGSEDKLFAQMLD